MTAARENQSQLKRPSFAIVTAKPHPERMRLHDGRVIHFPAVMGVLNVTPDSFSDGGKYLDPERAIAHALEMQEAGADIIDIGAESTRPVGAQAVAVEEELKRLVPVLRGLKGRLRVPFSIDTRKAPVARVALEHGAAIVNDVTALSYDPQMAPLVARSRSAVVLMHMRGSAENHMRFARYRNVVIAVTGYLAARVKHAIRAGIPQSRIIIDPGIGFAKTAQHNLALLNALPTLCALGYPVLVGTSRKTFIRRIAGDSVREVEFGTAAADALAVAAGASIVRVHDPGAARAAVRMAAAMRDGTK
ncbi:MAG: dihydropteroate synthase [Candidatus Binataceae bacterium]